jgi:hypothetical protein
VLHESAVGDDEHRGHEQRAEREHERAVVEDRLRDDGGDDRSREPDPDRQPQGHRIGSRNGEPRERADEQAGEQDGENEVGAHERRVRQRGTFAPGPHSGRCCANRRYR